MGSQNQIISAGEIAVQLLDEGVGMARPRYNRVTVMSHHVSVDGVRFGNFHIKSIGGGADAKFYSTNGDKAFLQIVCNSMDRGVKAFTKIDGKAVNEGLSATAVAIDVGVAGSISFYTWKERAAGHMVGCQQAGNL